MGEFLLHRAVDFFMQKIGLIPIIVVAIIIYVIFYIALLVIFTILRRNDNRASRRRVKLSIRQPWASLRRTWASLWDYHYIGRSWLINYMEFCMWTIAFFSGAIGYWRAITFKPEEFGRSSAVICVAGLLAVALGLAQTRVMQRTADRIIERASTSAKKRVIARYITLPKQKVQEHALIVSTIISIVGTLLWAYGDQFVPPKEESAVSECQCMKVIIRPTPLFYGY